MARGDHIKVRRWRGLYSHHGIDMGDGTVIHLAGEPFRGRNARVCRTDSATFLAGGTARVVAYGDDTRSREESAAVAEQMLCRTGYCLWSNNCEHFASYCRTGMWRSRQVRRAVRLGGAVTGATAVLLLSLVDRRSVPASER